MPWIHDWMSIDLHHTEGVKRVMNKCFPGQRRGAIEAVYSVDSTVTTTDHLPCMIDACNLESPLEVGSQSTRRTPLMC